MDSESSQAMSNPEIKSSLLTIYDKIGMPPTKDVGYELFIQMVLNNSTYQNQMLYIINQVGDFINSLNPKEKEPYLKLLSLIFFNPNQPTTENTSPEINPNNYTYLSPVLNIIQTLVKDANNTLFPMIANTYADIVQYIMPTDINVSKKELKQEVKRAYEILQGFCIYNMKCEEKANRIIGSLCLTKLVENCPIVLQTQYTKFIWDNISYFIDKKNFNAKYELLNCLISLILGAESLFCPYANVTLYKVLDFLTDSDWLKRKLALNVIYTLIFYCKDEILPLKDHIINFLRVLKTDKVKEVREVCLLILQIFSENEPKNESQPENYSAYSQKNTPNDAKNENKSNSSNKKMNKTKSQSKTRIKKNNVKNTPNFKFEFVGEKFDNNDNLVNNNEIENKVNNARKISLDNDVNNKPKTPFNRNLKQINDNSSNNITPHNKCINRKEDNTFVNEKMVIKPDPSKSIFHANPNPAFFNQKKAKSNTDIIVVTKGQPLKYDNNIQEKPINNNINNNQIEIKQPKKAIDKNKNIENDRIEKNNVKKEETELKTKYNNNINLGKNIEKNNKNKNNNNLNNIVNDNKNKKFDSMTVNVLLSQMNSLSAKQVSLLDVMENIQVESKEEIDELNQKILFLDSQVDALTNELNRLRRRGKK